MAQTNFKHGYHGSRTYKSWSEMIYRCNKVGKKYWHDKGITVCESWKDFRNFLQDMGPRPIGKTLDRINLNTNYCKENCRWATNKEQQNNKSSIHLFEFNGQKKTLIDWSEVIGVKRSTLAQRYYVYGWSVNRTLSTIK
jgi:hypothetical protein